MSVKRPGVALGLIMSHYAIKQATQSMSPSLVTAGAMMSYAIFSVAILAIIAMVFRGDFFKVPFSRQGWLVWLLVGWALLSTLWSMGSETYDQWTKWIPYIVGYALLAPLVIRHMPDWRDALVTMVVVGTLTLGSLVFGSSWDAASRTVELVSESGAKLGANPLAIGQMGGYLAITMLLINIPMRKWYWHAFRWGILLMGLAAGFRSSSRGQVIGAIFCMLLFLPMSRGIRHVRQFLGLALVGLVVLAGSYVMLQDAAEINAKRWDVQFMKDDVQSTRLETAWTVVDAWMKSEPVNQLLGIGSSASFNILGIYPHFVPGEVLAELGPLAFVAYLALLGTTLTACYFLYRQSRDYPDARGYVAVLSALAMYEFLLSCKQGSFLGNTGMMLLAIVAGRLSLMVAKQQQPAAELSLLERSPVSVG